ncbi:MAG TPA: gamma-glutamyl-gamma-aminobutyrate hydrolase family protein, partial [Bacteroidia bacterium]|nr:gamma-glutamyl-gamma-aminobutyrate hydrolase family protein [Bacteroidia bacterium]
KNLAYPFHGVSRTISPTSSDEPLFKGLPATFRAGNYHSWVVDRAGLPEIFQITAVDQDENIMAVSDRRGWLKGIQFHPESILTAENGEALISNWLAFSNVLIQDSLHQFNIK